MASPAIAQSEATIVSNVQELRSLVARQSQLAPAIRGYSFGSWTGEVRGKRVLLDEVALEWIREFDPRGRCYYDYHTRVLGRISEGGEYYRLQQRRGYDGSLTWLHEISEKVEGQDGEPRQCRTGQLLPDRNGFEQRAVGWTCTLPGFYDSSPGRLVDLLSAAEARFTWEERDEGEVVLLSLPSRDGEGVEAWELKRSWRYGLHRYSRHKLGRLLEERLVDRAVQVHPAFFYPIAFTMFDDSTALSRNAHYEGSVQEPALVDKVDDDVFAPRFPHGTTVYDTISGEVVRIAAPDPELDASIATQAGRMKELVWFRPRKSIPWLQLAGAAIAVLGAMLLASRIIVRARRRDRSASRASGGGPLLIVASVIWLPASAAAQTPWLEERLPGTHTDNCAVNSVALIASLFGRAANVDGIASRLGCGPARIEAIDLGRMATVLGQMGLRIDPFRAATLEQIEASCSETGSVAIVHATTSSGLGHYFVVAPTRGGVVVCDPAERMVECSLEDLFARKLARRLSGAGLLIAKGPSSAAWRVDREDVFTVALGAVSPTRHGLVVPLEFDGRVARRVRIQESTCTCLREVDIDRGDLAIQLDGALLSTQVEPHAAGLLFEGDGWSIERRLVVAAARTPTTRIAETCVLPSLVRAPANGEGQCHAFVTVVVPSAGIIASWRSSEGVRVTPSTMSPVAGGVAWRHRVDWAAETAWVEFLVNDGGGAEKRVACHLRRDGSRYASAPPTNR